MIIDLILDRKDGADYVPKKFYRDALTYGKVGNEITKAMDYEEEQDVKKALEDYIIDNEYSSDIISYINSVNWLGERE